MKLHTTTAVVALLASTLALGGCGDQAASNVDSKGEVRTIGYGNYLPRSASASESVDHGPYMGKLERLEARTSGQGTPDRAHVFE
ncbi:hypothetical protein MWU75_10020 [Ornithinimicrobium sp. F0845]|uniref:hypothetical protein n=1 Tax=Ornithinimicrobium sp. F0845 TaxID=2926412 RepID=UPI001FF3B6C1|nr:hypothetical protein [Ornithinimicrobium sp. F0845]MCK0112473.1 hypothetical protein [Ornithinimicrobium sp. F0845]